MDGDQLGPAVSVTSCLSSTPASSDAPVTVDSGRSFLLRQQRRRLKLHPTMSSLVMGLSSVLESLAWSIPSLWTQLQQHHG